MSDPLEGHEGTPLDVISNEVQVETARGHVIRYIGFASSTFNLELR